MVYLYILRDFFTQKPFLFKNRHRMVGKKFLKHPFTLFPPASYGVFFSSDHLKGMASNGEIFMDAACDNFGPFVSEIS